MPHPTRCLQDPMCRRRQAGQGARHGHRSRLQIYEFRTTKVFHEDGSILGRVVRSDKNTTVRGLLWCGSTNNSKFVNRDLNGAVNIRRCVVSPVRPPELSRVSGQQAIHQRVGKIHKMLRAVVSVGQHYGISSRRWTPLKFQGCDHGTSLPHLQVYERLYAVVKCYFGRCTEIHLAEYIVSFYVLLSCLWRGCFCHFFLLLKYMHCSCPHRALTRAAAALRPTTNQVQKQMHYC
jgi:hypothetical protein